MILSNIENNLETLVSKNLAIVFDIQRFSLHDGPGIRTTIFFKGCPISCAWCQNPESHKIKPEIAFYSDRCQGCFKCREVCLENAVLDKKEQNRLLKMQ
mmetsp:Transcript_4891/g.2729  ORF Transcript_4891/g.2729 Transcript_4891/m.2729 type:complete len:99 (-) Transcript_4891:3078-3374(-)